MIDNEIEVETVVIGGGFSGLFLADIFIRSGYNSFLLLERQKNNMGGYAVYGGIKVSLLPAGESTKIALQLDSYEFYENQFLKRYMEYLIRPQRDKLEIDFDNAGFKNKYYYSYILPRINAKRLVLTLFESIKDNIVFATVEKIIIDNNGYTLYLTKKSRVKCKRIIIATGRCYNVTSLLKKIGQIFEQKHNLLFGCRVTFDSNNVERLFKYQPDFKIKDNMLHQTYCFNYRGTILSYLYKKHKIYTGSFNENSLTGNCFIGCRKIATPEYILSSLNYSSKMSYVHFRNNKWPKPLRQDFFGLCNFIDKFENTFELRIKNLYLPALEQYWPKPALSQLTLESSSLPNIYFIGDASGVSYGFMQCYITANYLIDILRENDAFH